MPIATGPEHDEEDLDGLRELQPERWIPGHEVPDREVRDEGERHDRNYGVDRRERDVQRDVAAEQVAVEVRRSSAGRRGEHHHADREHGGEVEREHEPEADRWQDHQLADERDEHRLRVLRDAGEVAHGEAEAQAEHNDAEGDGQSNGGQR